MVRKLKLARRGAFWMIALGMGVGMAATAANKNLYDYTVDEIDGRHVSLADYRGKVALVVNTASKCGFTPQYEGLQKLYDTYHAKGFVVLGFPSNDFGGQEPGSNQEIAQFCAMKFKTSFPIFSKAHVIGDSKQPVYQFLTEQSDKAYRGDIKWNFTKFLVDRTGTVIGRFESKVKPEELNAPIEAALKKSGS